MLLYTNCLHSEWSLTEIKGILMRRYLFQSNAVEIFFARQGLFDVLVEIYHVHYYMHLLYCLTVCQSICDCLWLQV